MKNQLLLYCRKKNNLSRREVARKIRISTSQYKEIENGELLMSPKIARRLNKLFKIHKGDYMLDAACQLDMLHERLAMVKLLRDDKSDLLATIEALRSKKNQPSQIHTKPRK